VRQYILDLNIPSSELLRYYRGSASSVTALDRNGRRVQFPAQVLRPFVGRDGVQGTFTLWVGAGNRLQNIQRVH
jgi:hypothetical protein